MMYPNLAGKRVLVVEDEMLVALLVEDVLLDAGCVVVGPFSRVPAGLAAAMVELVDVALLDVNVANEKVFPIAYALEERGIPFLFVTGYGEAALPKDRPDWEACPKPFQPGQLAERLAPQGQWRLTASRRREQYGATVFHEERWQPDDRSLCKSLRGRSRI